MRLMAFILVVFLSSVANADSLFDKPSKYDSPDEKIEKLLKIIDKQEQRIYILEMKIEEYREKTDDMYLDYLKRNRYKK